MNKALVPQIRFKGFTYAWELKRFGEILNKITRKGYTELPQLTASKAGTMFIRSQINYSISVSDTSLKSYVLVDKDDFVLHLSTYDSGLAYSPFRGITSPAYSVLKFSEPLKSDPIFWKYVFNGKKFIKSLIPFTYGLRVGKTINLDELNESYLLTTQLPEQNKIAQTFSTLDSLLTLHQRKCDALKKIKQTLLEKMFPVEGSNIPSIRFAGFTYAWELKRFGEILNKITRKGYAELPQLTASKAGTMFIRSQINYSISVSDTSLKSYVLVDKDDFVLHLSTYDSGLAYSPFRGITSPAYSVLKFSEPLKSDPIFWKYVFNGKKFIKSLIPFTYGLRVGKTINLDELNESYLLTTQLPEQNKIAQTFSTLDSLLTLHQRKCEKLKKIKQELLNKMFV